MTRVLTEIIVEGKVTLPGPISLKLAELRGLNVDKKVLEAAMSKYLENRAKLSKEIQEISGKLANIDVGTDLHNKFTKEKRELEEQWRKAQEAQEDLLNFISTVTRMGGEVSIENSTYGTGTADETTIMGIKIDMPEQKPRDEFIEEFMEEKEKMYGNINNGSLDFFWAEPEAEEAYKEYVEQEKEKTKGIIAAAFEDIYKWQDKNRPAAK